MTAKQHVALLVEDDAEIATELICLLESLGHRCVHVETRVAAEAAITSTDFCFVILDLQIKATENSLAPKVESGRTLLKHLRERYPERSRTLGYRTPVLVLSAHTRGREETIRLAKLGADDVLEKPLSANRPSLDVRIDEALARSGRKNHAQCCDSFAQPSDTEQPQPVLSIDVSKRLVTYRGHQVPTRSGSGTRHLQKQAFAVLVALAEQEGIVINGDELDQFLLDHDLLDDKIGPSLSAIKSRILRPIRDVLEDSDYGAEIDRLITVSGPTICLRANGEVNVVGLSELAKQTRAPALARSGELKKGS